MSGCEERPLDEVYDTMMEVERDPCGAWMAIQSLSAALERARKVIERQDDALRPMSDAVYNDNGDLTISLAMPDHKECEAAYFASRSARAWMEQNALPVQP